MSTENVKKFYEAVFQDEALEMLSNNCEKTE